MERISYGAQLSPSPIKLSIGTIIKPTLRKISDVTFERFNFYETLLKLTPESYYLKVRESDGKKCWDSFTEKEKDDMTVYGLISKEPSLSNLYIEMFSFFFEESVVFDSGLFVLLDPNIHCVKDVESRDQIHGVISEKSFNDVLYIIQQICCIDDPKKNDEQVRFKNSLAQKLYEKMQKAAKKESDNPEDLDFSIPNIISAVSNKHPSINPINIWNLTIFQLLDTFNRMRNNTYFDIDSNRVSVWGDEKKTYKDDLWYKNIYDKK